LVEPTHPFAAAHARTCADVAGQAQDEHEVDGRPPSRARSHRHPFEDLRPRGDQQQVRQRAVRFRVAGDDQLVGHGAILPTVARISITQR
jgi:hypothetical protein